MFREMRLTKQQLPDEEALAILEKGGTGTLALLGDEGYPYSVPVNYMYEDGCIYFHSAKDGHKVDAIARESKASMSVITKDVLMPEKYNTEYCSVIVVGNITLITEDEKKRRMIYSFTKKFCSEYESGIDAEIDGAWNRLHVYELKIEHMTGKRAMP